MNDQSNFMDQFGPEQVAQRLSQLQQERRALEKQYAQLPYVQVPKRGPRPPTPGEQVQARIAAIDQEVLGVQQGLATVGTAQDRRWTELQRNHAETDRREAFRGRMLDPVEKGGTDFNRSLDSLIGGLNAPAGAAADQALTPKDRSKEFNDYQSFIPQQVGLGAKSMAEIDQKWQAHTQRPPGQQLGRENYIKELMGEGLPREVAEERARKLYSSGGAGGGEAFETLINSLNGGGGGMPAPTAVPPSAGATKRGKPLDKATAAALIEEAGGDKAKARQLARQRGYEF